MTTPISDEEIKRLRATVLAVIEVGHRTATFTYVPLPPRDLTTLLDEIDRLRVENAKIRAESWPKAPSKIMNDLEARLAKAVATLEKIADATHINQGVIARQALKGLKP